MWEKGTQSKQTPSYALAMGVDTPVVCSSQIRESMKSIDDLFDAFLESASRHHIPEDVLRERAMQERQERKILDSTRNAGVIVSPEPVLGGELCDFLCEVWEEGC